MIQILRHQHSQEEDWGFLLIDLRNTFNEDNRTAILWVVQNKWPSGAQFNFNCYRHWAILVIQDGGVQGTSFTLRRASNRGGCMR